MRQEIERRPAVHSWLTVSATTVHGSSTKLACSMEMALLEALRERLPAGLHHVDSAPRVVRSKEAATHKIEAITHFQVDAQSCDMWFSVRALRTEKSRPEWQVAPKLDRQARAPAFERRGSVPQTICRGPCCEQALQAAAGRSIALFFLVETDHSQLRTLQRVSGCVSCS